MPIKPKNQARYPANWKQLRAAVLERAGHKCEQCGLPNYALVQTVDGERQCAGGSAYYDQFQYTVSFAEANAARLHLNHYCDENYIVVVLTIAHLEHDELETQDISRLRAWCQKCHLTYDAKHHAQTAYHTRKARAQTADMFA